MSMSLTIDLPDEVAVRLASLPEDEQRRFSIAAITDALAFRLEEEGDCQPVIEQALADMDAGIGLVSFEELCRQWDAEGILRK
jgi:predicted transcriptional regulator